MKTKLVLNGTKNLGTIETFLLQIMSNFTVIQFLVPYKKFLVAIFIRPKICGLIVVHRTV